MCRLGKSTPSGDRSFNPGSMYAHCMEEIKKRIEVVNAFLTGECHAKYPQTTAESIYLQIRKILELIALASLCVNRSEYEKHRKNFHRDWNGKRIIETLEKANPRFYPQPTEQIVDRGTDKVVEVREIESGFLTKKDYIELYDLCGAILHAENPFAQESEVQPLLNRVPFWVSKIMLLLNHHQIQLLDARQQVWVLMESKGDGRVHVYEFEQIG